MGRNEGGEEGLRGACPALARPTLPNPETTRTTQSRPPGRAPAVSRRRHRHPPRLFHHLPHRPGRRVGREDRRRRAGALPAGRRRVRRARRGALRRPAPHLELHGSVCGHAGGVVPRRTGAREEPWWGGRGGRAGCAAPRNPPQTPTRHTPLSIVPSALSQEVFTDAKPRLSISGWYHAPAAPDGASAASLAQLTAGPAAGADAAGGHAPYPGGLAAMAGPLSEADVAQLAPWLNPAYLKPETWARVAAEFESGGSVRLARFLAPGVAAALAAGTKAADEKDGVGRGRAPDVRAGYGNGEQLNEHVHRSSLVAGVGEVEGLIPAGAPHHPPPRTAPTPLTLPCRLGAGRPTPQTKIPALHRLRGARGAGQPRRRRLLPRPLAGPRAGRPLLVARLWPPAALPDNGHPAGGCGGGAPHAPRRGRGVWRERLGMEGEVALVGRSGGKEGEGRLGTERHCAGRPAVPAPMPQAPEHTHTPPPSPPNPPPLLQAWTTPWPTTASSRVRPGWTAC